MSKIPPNLVELVKLGDAENVVFSHYCQKNSASGSFIGAGTTLAGLISLTALNYLLSKKSKFDNIAIIVNSTLIFDSVAVPWFEGRTLHDYLGLSPNIGLEYTIMFYEMIGAAASNLLLLFKNRNKWKVHIIIITLLHYAIQSLFRNLLIKILTHLLKINGKLLLILNLVKRV